MGSGAMNRAFISRDRLPADGGRCATEFDTQCDRVDGVNGSYNTTTSSKGS